MGHYSKQTDQKMFQAQKTQTDPQKGVVPLDPQNRGDLAPIIPIRTETVFSKLPIHNLAKRGSLNIRITHQDHRGKINFSWSVSPNRDYGEPRQLAFKIDKLLIDRRLDELGRPLPSRYISLGSLRQLAIQIGLGSGNTNLRGCPELR